MKCNYHLDEIDILLADIDCEKEVAEEVELRGGDAVSSEWLMDVSSSYIFFIMNIDFTF